MSATYTNPVKLSVSFDKPRPAEIVLQGPALTAYYDWKLSGADEDLEYLEELIIEQTEDHVAAWTLLGDWREV